VQGKRAHTRTGEGCPCTAAAMTRGHRVRERHPRADVLSRAIAVPGPRPGSRSSRWNSRAHTPRRAGTRARIAPRSATPWVAGTIHSRVDGPTHCHGSTTAWACRWLPASSCVPAGTQPRVRSTRPLAPIPPAGKCCETPPWTSTPRQRTRRPPTGIRGATWTRSSNLTAGFPRPATARQGVASVLRLPLARRVTWAGARGNPDAVQEKRSLPSVPWAPLLL